MLRLAVDPTDEDAIGVILTELLVVPAISARVAAEKYDELLIKNGYATIPALKRLTMDKLEGLGVRSGHADLR